MMKKLLSLFLVLFCYFEVSAQGNFVSGKVTTTDDGSPLPGVSILLKGSTKGVQSDANGVYKIEVPKEGTLVFSFIGFLSKEVKVGNQSIIDVQLAANDALLNEVVVVGYGTLEKKNVTGSLSSVKGDAIANLPTPNFANQLAGRAAGVQVSVPSGILGQDPRVRIRGTNSISSGGEPLYVIDNVPVATSTFGGVGPASPLSDINPSDIESIEVLKDGASTAIFGSRAANGVILITTKHGKGNKGKMVVNYDMFVGQNQAVNRFDLLDATNFVKIANEKYTNAGQPAQAVADPNGVNTDWQKVILRNGFVQNHALSFSGANDRTNYFFSLGYLTNSGVIISNNQTRYSFRGNMDHTVNKWLTIGTSISYSRGEFSNLNTGTNALSGNIAGAARLLPNVSPYDVNNLAFDGYNVSPDGAALAQGSNLRLIDNNYTNLAFVLAKNKFLTTNSRTIGNAYGEIEFIPGLKLRSQIAADLLSQDDFQSYDPRHGDGRGANGYVFQRYRPVTLWNWQNTLSYNKAFGKFTVNAVAGLEYQKTTSKRVDASGQGFSSLFFVQNNLIDASYGTQFSGGDYVQTSFDSYFGRINANYGGKYYFSFTLRNDGLSSLPVANRRGTFPGGSLAYRISEEEFFKNSPIHNYISDFRLRASYAVVGNTDIGAFPYLGTFGAAQYASETGIAFNNTGNPALKWEQSKKKNFGVDLGFFKNRATINADYFINDIDNLILFAPTAPSLGVPGNGINKNVGAMQNKGFELSLAVRVIEKKDFTWDMDFNYANVQNKITALNENQDINYTYNINRVGYSIGSFYGYNWAGVNSANGNPMWYKGDGNGNVTSTIVQYDITSGKYFEYNSASPTDLSKASSLSATTDRTILGKSSPTFFGGWTNSVHFKGFDLGVFVRYSGGNKVMNVTRQETLLNQGFLNNGTEILDRWTTAGQITNVPKLWIGKDAAINNTGTTDSRFLEKGDFVRIQSITLGYSIPKTLLEKTGKNGIRSLRVYAQVQNPVVFTKYTGLDPELSSLTTNNQFGVDYNANPIIRTLSFGLNLGL